jgi:signal peptidase I
MPLGSPVRRRLGRRLLAVAVLALAGVGLAMHQDVKYYRVTSGSMEPTLKIGSRVAAVGSQTPKIGDIVVFHPPAGARPSNPVCGAADEGSGSTSPCDVPLPQESSAIFVKRVVAGPGDLISIVNGHAVLNGTAENEPYIAACSQGSSCSFPTPVRVPAGDYYMLGDNRGVSDDSRYWGPVPRAWIIGTAVRCSLFGTVCHAIR